MKLSSFKSKVTTSFGNIGGIHLKKLIASLLIFSIFIISSCKDSNIEHGKASEDPELKNVISSYFTHFNNIQEWRKYSTDGFVTKVYTWCIGDPSSSMTLDKMINEYYQSKQNSLQLTDYYIDNITYLNQSVVQIDVTRMFEDDSQDQTFYEIIKENNEWKFDDRF